MLVSACHQRFVINVIYVTLCQNKVLSLTSFMLLFRRRIWLVACCKVYLFTLTYAERKIIGMSVVMVIVMIIVMIVIVIIIVVIVIVIVIAIVIVVIVIIIVIVIVVVIIIVVIVILIVIVVVIVCCAGC